MTGKTFGCLILLALFPGVATADSVDWLKNGQDAIYRLDFDRAEKTFLDQISAHPQDPVGYAMLAITKWNLLLKAAGNLALEDWATPTPFNKQKTQKKIDVELRAFQDANRSLVELCDRILKEKPEDVLALYFKGVAFENLASLDLAVTKDSFAAIGNGKKAVNLHERVLKLDPKFVDAQVSIATAEFAHATLPWGIRWIAFLIGFRGNKEEALAKLEMVGRSGKYRQLDAKVVLALLNSWKGDPKISVRLFEEMRKQFPENYLFDINLAGIYQLQLKDPKAAIRVYQELASSLDRKAPGIKPGEVQYRMGKTYYEMRDYSLAREALEKALNSPCEERETAPLAAYLIGKIHEDQGDRDAARPYFQQVTAYSGPSGAIQDEIKYARKRAGK